MGTLFIFSVIIVIIIIFLGLINNNEGDYIFNYYIDICAYKIIVYVNIAKKKDMLYQFLRDNGKKCFGQSTWKLFKLNK